MVSPASVRPVRASQTSAASAQKTWAHLRIIERIGEGAFGEVYRAFDPRRGGDVALKVLRAGVSSEPPQVRVIRESRNLGRVQHPNVVAVYGARASVKRAGFWMELIRGTTLTELLRALGPFTVERAAIIGCDLCRALAAVHEAGVVHGDVKAQNVMREKGGRVVLMDFGSSRCPEHNRTGLERLTGTPAYLAPEVLSGTEPCIASDVYSLGVLLFHLVTGDYPVQGGSADEIRRAHASRSVRRVTDLHGGLPDAFVRAVDGALSPADSRYRNTDDLLAVLRQVRISSSIDGSIFDSVFEPSAAMAAAETAKASLLEQTRTFSLA